MTMGPLPTVGTDPERQRAFFIWCQNRQKRENKRRANVKANAGYMIRQTPGKRANQREFSKTVKQTLQQTGKQTPA